MAEAGIVFERGTPLGTAESASSAVYVPSEPQVPEWQARYPARAFRAGNSRVVTLEDRKAPPYKYEDMNAARNHVWLEAIGSVRSRNTEYGAFLPHPKVPGLHRQNFHKVLYVVGIDRDEKELDFIKEFQRYGVIDAINYGRGENGKKCGWAFI
eukprot:5295272-Alexandrium_andersonii.AAC.1